MNLLDKYFVGAYFFYLHAENSGSKSHDGYFAYTAILAMTCFIAVFIAGCVFWTKKTDYLLNTWINILAIVVLFALLWAIYGHKRRYVALVEKYYADRVRLRRMSILASVFSLLFFSIGFWS